MQFFSGLRLLVILGMTFLSLSSLSAPASACMACVMLECPGCVVVFSPDGKLLASANAHKRTTTELWNLPKLRLWKHLPEGQGVVAIAFSPDGKLLALGGLTNKVGFVSLWKLPEGKRVKRLKINPDTIWSRSNNYIRSLAFSPDSKLLAAGTGNGEIYLWELPKGKLVSIFLTRKGIGCIVASVAFSPDGKKLAALLGSDDLFQVRQVFQVWQVNNKKLLWEQEYEATCFQVAFSPNGRKLVGAGCSFLLCDASNGQVILKRDLDRYYSPPGAISFDGRYVAMIAHNNTSVKVCRTSDLKEVWRKENYSLKLRFQLHYWAEVIENRLGLPATNWFTRPKRSFAFGFAFSRDNRWLALGFEDGSVKLWRIR